MVAPPPLRHSCSAPSRVGGLGAARRAGARGGGVDVQAGAFDAALQLVATAEAGPLDESQRARVDLLRGHIDASGLSSDAPPLLLKAARRLEQVDLDFARQTYLFAWVAAHVIRGNPEGPGALLQISRAILDIPRPRALRPIDLLLDGLALMTTDGRAAATPTLQRAAKVLGDIPVEDVLGWGWIAMAASNAVWDNDGAYAISARACPARPRCRRARAAAAAPCRVGLRRERGAATWRVPPRIWPRRKAWLP